MASQEDMLTQLADFPITRRWPPTHPERLQLYTLGTPMGDDYTIADIAIFPWVRGMLTHYLAGELVGIADFPHVTRVMESFLARPAVQRGMQVP